ncbi:MAG TPA: hypothetical protein PKY81_08400 [bacterium]|nr:hypothetical protein [bacterium]HPN30965.1 hypothetical protein [bacterium]
MSSVVLLKKILLIFVIILISSIDNIPYISKILPYYLKNQFKEYNRQIKVGDIDFSIRSGEIKISDLKILNAKSKPEIEIKTIRINLAVWNILKKNIIDVSYLKIDGLKLKLSIKEGKTNLDYLFQDDKKSKPKENGFISAEDFQKNYSFKNVEFTNSDIEIAFDSDKLILNNASMKISEITNNSAKINILFECGINRGKMKGYAGLNMKSENINFSVNADNIDLTVLKNAVKTFSGASLYGLNCSGFMKGSIYRQFKDFDFECALNCLNGTLDYQNYTSGFRNLNIEISEFSSLKKILDIKKIEANHFYLKTDYQIKTGGDTINNNFASKDTETTPKNIGVSRNNENYSIFIKDLTFKNSNMIFKIGLKNDTLSISFDSVFVKTNSFEYDGEKFFADAEFNSLVNGAGSLVGFLNYKNARNFSTNFSVKNLSLPNFNPYFKDYTGYRFLIGKSDIENYTELSDTEINSNTKLSLHNPEIKKINDIFDLPLEFALKKLKDKNGTVKLEIPVKGRIDDMEFSYSKAVWKIIGKTILSPFALFLKPFDSKDENYFLIQFDYNSSQLNLNALNALNSVGDKLLADKKKNYKIELKFATTLKEANLAHIDVLFKRRVKNIENYLKTHYNVNPKRILYGEIIPENFSLFEKELIELKLIE